MISLIAPCDMKIINVINEKLYDYNYLVIKFKPLSKKIIIPTDGIFIRSDLITQEYEFRINNYNDLVSLNLYGVDYNSLDCYILSKLGELVISGEDFCWINNFKFDLNKMTIQMILKTKSDLSNIKFLERYSIRQDILKKCW